MTEQVYFAYGFYRGSWKIKIGYSQNVAVRIKGLRNAFGVDMTLLASVNGTTFDESALHLVMRNSRYEREWFHPNKRLHAIIAYAKDNDKLPPGITDLGLALWEETLAKRARVKATKVANEYAVAISAASSGWPYRSHEKIDRNDLKCIPLAMANVG